MPDETGLELIAKRLREAAPDAVSSTDHFRGQATLIVNPLRIRDVLAWLRETDDQAYHFLSSLHGADYLPASPRFGVHYVLLNMERVERIHVKAPLDDPGDADSLPRIDSVVDIFPTAEFQEREVFDMFGIHFSGHPDLRRILLPENYVGWPQRRDFPLGGEPVMFTHNEHKMPRWYE